GEAVVKAAQAAGAGNLFTYANPSLSYIRDVHTLSGNAPIVEDFTLQDLGYSNQQLSGIGIQQADFSFFAAKEQLATDKGLLRLVYYHSGLLDYGVSSISVELNGQAVFSVPFSKDTEQVTTAEVKIP
ncbi:MAG: cellulose biosynthesis cyclic di-GMP-binding regulatory protein BcsB, partial [Anaerolineales bacterium]|nr:cellulose biosynthesis cyclic di-GMP-binding regulatory protein BcsB [Anaerolineales bacterium]